jgi:hypothetical protein
LSTKNFPAEQFPLNSLSVGHSTRITIKHSLLGPNRHRHSVARLPENIQCSIKLILNQLELNQFGHTAFGKHSIIGGAIITAPPPPQVRIDNLQINTTQEEDGIERETSRCCGILGRS